MPNINKVVYGNTTLIDLTDTTAEAADVAQGKYFYGKDGVKTAGTASGGSGSGGIIYQDLDGYLHLSEDSANVISIVDELDTAGGTIRTITGATESGGGSSVDRGTFTPSSNTLSVSLSVTRTVVGVMIIAETNPYQAGSGVRCLSGCLYDSSDSVAKINIGSNAAGTSGAVSYGASNLTVSQSGTTLTVTSANAASNGYFISGITYRWIAW